jgi:hypothetical protein
MKRRLNRIVAAVALLVPAPLFSADPGIGNPPAAAPAAVVPDQAALEANFAKLLTNAVMVGSYTVGKDGKPHADRYTILKATKGEGDEWIITAKVEYKGFAVPVDIAVPVKWAGDTPVISLTNKKILGLGTFSARVMFYDNQYAGTWDAGDHGGQMWGRIERAEAAGPATKPAK